MVKYNVWFTINGEAHYSMGTSTSPTLQELNKGTYGERIALDNAMMFISGYMDVMRIDGRVDRNSIRYTMEPDKD